MSKYYAMSFRGKVARLRELLEYQRIYVEVDSDGERYPGSGDLGTRYHAIAAHLFWTSRGDRLW